MTDRDLEQRQLATAAWSSLLPGAELTIVKLAPDGSEAARYRGEVVGHRQDSWVLVQATWTNRTIELGGLSFCPGDNLLEWFSPRHPFNAFAVFSPQDRLKGWYANVTHPARLDATAGSAGPVLARPLTSTWWGCRMDRSLSATTTSSSPPGWPTPILSCTRVFSGRGLS